MYQHDDHIIDSPNPKQKLATGKNGNFSFVGRERMVNVWNVKADKIGQQSLHVPEETRTLPPLRFGMGTRTSPQVFVFFCKMFNKINRQPTGENKTQNKEFPVQSHTPNRKGGGGLSVAIDLDTPQCARYTAPPAAVARRCVPSPCRERRDDAPSHK